jgi:hypothetical protein
MPAGSDHGNAALSGFRDMNRSIVPPLAGRGYYAIFSASLKLDGKPATFSNRR